MKDNYKTIFPNGLATRWGLFTSKERDLPNKTLAKKWPLTTHHEKGHLICVMPMMNIDTWQLTHISIGHILVHAFHMHNILRWSKYEEKGQGQQARQGYLLCKKSHFCLPFRDRTTSKDSKQWVLLCAAKQQWNPQKNRARNRASFPPFSFTKPNLSLSLPFSLSLTLCLWLKNSEKRTNSKPTTLLCFRTQEIEILSLLFFLLSFYFLLSVLSTCLRWNLV